MKHRVIAHQSDQLVRPVLAGSSQGDRELAIDDKDVAGVQRLNHVPNGDCARIHGQRDAETPDRGESRDRNGEYHQRAGQRQISQHAEVSEDDGVSRLLGVDRLQDAQRGQAGHRHSRDDETCQNQIGVHPAHELRQAEHGQSRQNQQSQVAITRGQLTEHDFAITKVSGQQKLQGFSVLLFGDSASGESGRQQHHHGQLSDQEVKEECARDLGHFLGRYACIAIAVVKAGVGGPQD